MNRLTDLLLIDSTTLKTGSISWSDDNRISYCTRHAILVMVSVCINGISLTLKRGRKRSQAKNHMNQMKIQYQMKLF
jgi:hypothetical protein